MKNPLRDSSSDSSEISVDQRPIPNPNLRKKITTAWLNESQPKQTYGNSSAREVNQLHSRRKITDFSSSYDFDDDSTIAPKTHTHRHRPNMAQTTYNQNHHLNIYP